MSSSHSRDHEPGRGRRTGQDRSQQTLWQRDFPVPAADEEEVTRREFVRYLTLASGGLALATLGVGAWTGLQEPAPRRPEAIVALDELPVGGEHVFRYPTEQDPAILLRPAVDELRAYSQRCTHLACMVVWEREAGHLVCPCHHGTFDASDGRVLAGPPERPLSPITLEVRDGVVWAVGGGGH